MDSDTFDELHENQAQIEVLQHALKHLNDLREDVDMLVNVHRDRKAPEGEFSEVVVTLLQNIRTVEYLLDEALMMAELESVPFEEEDGEPGDLAN